MRFFSVFLLACLQVAIVTANPAIAETCKGESKGLAPGEVGIQPTTAAELYTVAPEAAGVSLNPLGASVAFALRSPQYPATVRLLTTVGYDRSLTALGGLYSSLRYELASRATPDPTIYSVQAGVWPYDPHRTQRRRAVYGVKWSVYAPLLQDPVAARAAFDLGLIELVDSSAGLALDSRGELTVSRQTTDGWGYRRSGWQGMLTGVWSAADAGPSLGLWLDGAYTGEANQSWPLDLGLRFGYRPAWPIPILPTGNLGLMGSVGTHFKVPTHLSIASDFVRLRRVVLEPRLRLWSDASLNVGGDITLSLDTIVRPDRAVSVGASVGYARGLWYRLNFRVQP